MLLGAQLDPQEIDELMEEADVVCAILMTMIVMVLRLKKMQLPNDCKKTGK